MREASYSVVEDNRESEIATLMANYNVNGLVG